MSHATRTINRLIYSHFLVRTTPDIATFEGTQPLHCDLVIALLLCWLNIHRAKIGS